MYEEFLPTPDYTCKEASKLLGLKSPKIIYAWHKKGRIRFTLDSTNAYRVPYGEVYRILAARDER